MKSKKNIQTGFLKTKCCGCGVCAAVCPVGAISLRVTNYGFNLPVVDKALCINCGKCRRVCPKIRFDLNAMNTDIFGNLPTDYTIGNYLAIYSGYANDKTFRYNGSSGGMVTSLLCELLRKKIISGAIVTKLTYGKVLRSRSFLAETEEGIINARCSKYCPMSLSDGLSEIKNKNGKFAVVCLPCHAIALRKAMEIDKELSRKIAFIFTLFCNHTPSYKAIDFFLYKNNINSSEVNEFRWRGDGWPGKTTVTTKEKTFSLFFPNAWWQFFGRGYFIPFSCYCCADFFGEFSDLSFGDAWLEETKNDTTGTNVAIARSEQGLSLIKSMADANALTIKDLDAGILKKSFEINIRERKARSLSRIRYPREFKRLIKLMAGYLYFMKRQWR